MVFRRWTVALLALAVASASSGVALAEESGFHLRIRVVESEPEPYLEEEEANAAVSENSGSSSSDGDGDADSGSDSEEPDADDGPDGVGDGYDIDWTNWNWPDDVTPDVLGDSIGPFGQCGGTGYEGGETCTLDWVCVPLADSFSECLPPNWVTITDASGTATPTSTPTPTSTLPASTEDPSSGSSGVDDTPTPATEEPISNAPGSGSSGADPTPSDSSASSGSGSDGPSSDTSQPTTDTPTASNSLSPSTATDSGQARSARPTTDAWGTTIRKEQFQDMDESGHAREYIAEECLSPTQSKSWTCSTVERTNKNQYKMYWNNDQFLLSAKQVGGTFYISQYEHFPDAEADEPSGHYCAVLRKVLGHSFKLYNCGCEGCDMSFNTFTCSNIHEDASTAVVEGADRQLLADISHFTKAAGVVGSEMRCFSVTIPAVMEDRRSCVIWCPRVSRSVTPSGGTPRGTPQREMATSPSPHNKRQHRFSFDVPTSDRTKIGSKLPVWCPEVNSLMLKFHGGRIREASAKNFMLMVEDEPISSTPKGEPAGGDNSGVNRVFMQFGKFSKSKFALDFRYLLAPVQAFAIGLSSCAWNVKAAAT